MNLPTRIRPVSLPRFRAALKASEQTVGEWARLHRVSRQHLYEVIRGRRRSPRLTKALAAFVASYAEDAA